MIKRTAVGRPIAYDVVRSCRRRLASTVCQLNQLIDRMVLEETADFEFLCEFCFTITRNRTHGAILW